MKRTHRADERSRLAASGLAAPHRLAMLVAFVVAFAGSVAAFAALDIGAAQTEAKRDDFVRVTADQLHQLDVVAAELYPFQMQRSAVGQIAFDEDTTTPVRTPFSGRVTVLHAKIGDAVKHGDPLFEIASPDVVQPQNDYVVAITATNKARSQLNLAQIAETRAKGLYQGKAGPLKEWQQAQDALVAAQNDMRSAETALDAARHQLRIIGRSDEEIAALQSKSAISRSVTIYAPIDGTVIARKVGPGQYVRNDASDPLYTIADLSTMWLKAFVPEMDIMHVRVGQAIEVKVTALPDRVFKARITAIGAASDASTRRVVVRSEIPNPDGLLKSEMFASFKIATGEGESAPAVPVEAVIRESEAACVWVEREPMVFERRPVKIGREQDGRIQIREGLKAGERVVARGAIFVDNEWHQ
jgi:cobalt-zinc-cadmium efflux system membrane fusion protein